MKIGTQDKNRYYYEYVFWESIDSYNRRAKEDGDLSRVIRVSEARSFRQEMDERLGDRGFESTGMSDFGNTLNGVLSERMGGETPIPDSGAMKNLFQEYLSMTGLKPVREKVSTINERGNYLPLSPYDPRFSDRKSIRDLGSNLGAIDVTKVEDAELLSDFSSGQEIEVLSNLRFNENAAGTGWVVWQKEEPSYLTEPDDISGLTALLPFMSQEEYNSVSEWVHDGVNLNDLTPETLNRRRYNMEKSVAVLTELNNRGQEYKIQKDRFPGQIKARVSGTSVQVRLTDTTENQEYIGSIYDSGAKLRYVTTRRNYEHMATPEETVDLLRFSLGDPISRWDQDGYAGEMGQEIRQVSRQNRPFNSSYINTTGLSTVIGPLMIDNRPDPYGNQIKVQYDTSRRNLNRTVMDSPYDAEEYLKSAVLNARRNFYESLDVDRLIDLHHEHIDDDTFVPDFSGDIEIATLQESYWDVLTGKKDTLLIPGLEDDFNNAEFSDMKEEEDLFRQTAYPFIGMKDEDLVVGPFSPMSKEDLVKRHASDLLEHHIGTFEKDGNGKRFNAANVGVWNISAVSTYRNHADMVEAMRLLDLSPDELKDSDGYGKVIKDKLVTFDEASAVPMGSIQTPFMETMYDEVKTSLRTNGLQFNEEDILMDHQGIVRYKGQYATFESVNDAKGNTRPLSEMTGYIGQIFEPNEKGIIRTKFAGSDNYAFVAGYEASILNQKPGENLSVEERTRLKGYPQKMIENIRYNIRQDVLDLSKIPNNKEKVVGLTTNLNGTYRELYDRRFELDFEQVYRDQRMPEDVLDAILKTEQSRVRYSNEIRDNSTMFAASRAENNPNFDIANDNYGDTFVLTGGRNMAVLTKEADGYFDGLATTSTSTNQGIVRFLTEDAKVLPDGRIEKGSLDGRMPLLNNPLFQYVDFNSFDRGAMMISNVLDSTSVTDKAMVAEITLDGWTEEDGIVISKDFASTYPIRGDDGALRDLQAGDKISDMNGNKGVVSLVVDPEMDLLEAKRLDLEAPVKMFRENPKMQLAMAPFTAPSRYNGGTYREKSQNPENLYLNGKEIPGGLGSMRFVITDKSADVKTTIYTDDEVRAGKGRKASSQLAWSLNSKDAHHIMREFYGPNTGALSNYREYLVSLGLDISETGDLSVGYCPHEGTEREVFELPQNLAYRYGKDGSKQRVDINKMSEDFIEEVSRRGGIMEIPFPLKYRTGEDMPMLNDGKTDVIYEEKEWERKGYTRKDGIYVRPTTVKRRMEVGKRQVDDPTYGVPVMSAYLRSGAELNDGTSTVHDYTNQYIRIFKESVRYLEAKERLADPNVTAKDKARFERVLEDAPTKAQYAYNNITRDVEGRVFEGKFNQIREGIMSRRLKDSATAVWSPDPRLDVDTIAVGPKVAANLGIKEDVDYDQYRLIWRDPVLRNSGLKYMKTVIDPNLSGVAINPNSAAPFDGDFDGDTVALVTLHNKEAQKEAFEKFSFDANLLDKGSKTKVIDPRDGKTKEVFPLALNDGLDVSVAQYLHPEFKDEWDTMVIDINEAEEKWDRGVVGREAMNQIRKGYVRQLSDYYMKTLKAATGEAYIQCDTPEHHMESIHYSCLETGAKGSPSKVQGYATYAGFSGVEFTEEGMDLTHFKDHGKTLSTREMQQGVMQATAVKSFGTGVAGAISQKGMKTCRNTSPEAVLEITYPVTQSILQAKHDPVDAKHKYELLMGPVQDLWKGGLLEKNRQGEWAVVRDDDYKVKKATPTEWSKSLIDFYTAEDGLNVKINDDYVYEVAHNMVGDDGYVVGVDPSLEDGQKPLGSLMDRMAYGGSFDELFQAAKEGENLFEGRHNKEFAPERLRRNWEGEHRPFVKQDTLVHGRERRKQDAQIARKETQVQMGVKRAPNFDVIIPVESSNDYEI